MFLLKLKMKFFLTFFLIVLISLALVSAEESAPVEISNNNVGDIVTVHLNANAVLSSQIDQTILSVLVGLMNQQAAVVGTGLNENEN